MPRRARAPFTVYPRADSPFLWVQWPDPSRPGRPHRESTGEVERGAADARAAGLWAAWRARAGLCVAEGALDIEPVLRGPPKKLQRAEQRETRHMEPRERDRFLAHLKARASKAQRKALGTGGRVADPRAHRVYEVMFFTGWRRSTLERLLPRWVDWKRGEAHLPGPAMKNGRPWDGALHPRALAALRAQLRTLGKVVDPARPLFGGRIDYSNLFWATVARLGLDPHGLTPHHVARHSLATQLGKTESDLVLRSVLGWEGSEMPSRYTHGSVALTRKALRRIR